MIVCLFRDPDRGTWNVLRQAATGDHGRITSLCGYAYPYDEVLIQTVDLLDYDGELPHDLCPACRTELAASTPGAAQAIEPSRCRTRDLRAPERVAWDDLVSGPHRVRR